jgi:transposase
LSLLETGKTCAQVGAMVGVTSRTVERWRKSDRDGNQHVRKKAGIRPLLSERQLARLRRELARGAFAHGYAEDYWTLDRIAHLIWVLFHVRYHSSGVWRVMHRMGWSNQKPKRQALQRDDEQIARWHAEEWPRIKKLARPRSDAGV